MIIKSIDSKTQIIKDLKTLLNHPTIYESVKDKIKKEIYRIEKGHQNERDAAYYIDHYFASRKNWMVIHDLRLEVNDIKVQIDHLLMGRARNYILESKYFSSVLVYNNGNFSIKTTKGYIGIPSPLLQAERQIDNLLKIINALDIGADMSITFDYYVIVSPNTHMPGKIPDKIIKADSVGNKIDKDIENTSIGNAFKDAFSILTTKSDELEKVSKRLIRYHKPWDTSVYLKKLGIGWAEKLLQKSQITIQ